MGNICKRKRHILIILAAAFLFVLHVEVFAEGAAKIMSCRMVSAKKIQVVAAFELGKVEGNTCYLFSLPFTGGKLTKSSKPLKSAGKAATMTFSVKVPKSMRQTYYFSRYVIAQKNKKGKYEIISPACYITNPGKTARYTYSFPKASSKKGLQVCASMLEDAVDLNVQHSVLNINLGELMSTKGESHKGTSISYQYGGRTYWFRKRIVASYDKQLKALKETGTVVSAVLLLPWRDDLKYLIYPGGRRRGYNYYGWNMNNTKSWETFQAVVSFLASRYGTKKAKYGRIVNWIVGNEVDVPSEWNYCGKMSLQAYAANYAKQVRLTYTAVTSVYANARVYISLTHLWNTRWHGSYTARAMLDAFAAAISAQGYIPWNIAYHPYSSPLTEPRFWENRNQQLTAALTSPVINMGNLSVLTNYVKMTYGQNTRIILSEQGFTSMKKKKDAQADQTAAIAYSYLLTEADDMVDSFIMNRHVDHRVEMKEGLNLGLWTTSKMEWADKKKASWLVFKYMDSNLSEKVTAGSLSVIGIESWADVIAGYSSAFYSKYKVMLGELAQVGSYKKTASFPVKWKAYGAASNLKKKKKSFTVKHVNGSNRNCLWGFTQSFKKRASFSSHDMFYAAVRVKGASSRKALVRMRFFSGKNVFECSKQIKAGPTCKLGVSLAGWEYKNSVSKVQILVECTGGSWKKGAAVILSGVVRGKSPKPAEPAAEQPVVGETGQPVVGETGQQG